MRIVTTALLMICPLQTVAQEVPDHAFILHSAAHEDRAGLTFSPLITWTFQHATKVLPGMPHSKAVGYYDVTGGLTLWNNNDGLGQVMYQVQGNFAGGTSSTPSMAGMVGNPLAMNDILTSESFSLSDVYWQQSFSSHGVRLRVGKFHVSTFFDRNDIAHDPVAGFMSQNLNQSITAPMPGHGFGMNIEWDVADNSVIRIGTANSEPKGVRTSGFSGTSWGHLFTSAELDVTVNPIMQETERLGHYRFMLWNNGISNPNGPGNIDGFGGLCNIDQEITEHITVFGRIGWGESNVSVSGFSFSCGFQIKEPFGCKQSSTGFAYQYADLSSGGDQTVGELFYRTKWQEDSSLHVGPVIQYYEDDALNGAIIWGIRTSYRF